MSDSRPPLPPALRLVVVGNSTGIYVRPTRRHPHDGSYGELLERRLRAAGIEAHLFNEARWWDFIHLGFARFQEAISSHSPGVVILNYGMGECQPNVVPTSVIRWSMTWDTSLHPVLAAVGNRWRALVRKLIVWYTPRATRLTGTRTWRISPRRFAAELERLVTFTRRETGALVVVLTLNPPGPFLQQLMPGLADRADRYNGIIRDVVDRLDDDDVRVVDAGAVVDRLGWRRAMTDGLHYSAAGHRAVADLIEPAVLEWYQQRMAEGADEAPS